MSYLDKVTVGSTTYDIQDSKAQADVNDLKSAVSTLNYIDQEIEKTVYEYTSTTIDYTSRTNIRVQSGVLLDNGNSSTVGYAVRSTHASMYKATFGERLKCTDSDYHIRVGYYSTNSTGSANLVYITPYTDEVYLDPRYYFAICIALVDTTGTINSSTALAKVTQYFATTITAGLSDDIDIIDGDIKALMLGKYPVGILVAGQYVSTSDAHFGEFAAYSGWSRSDYIPVNAGQAYAMTSSVQSVYNVFYDSSKSPISGASFTIGTTETIITAPSTAAYMVLSNTTQGMSDTTISKVIKAGLTMEDIASKPKDYFASEAETTIQTIESHSDTPSFVMTVVADPHLLLSSADRIRQTQDTFANINYVTKYCYSDGLAIIGDMVQGNIDGMTQDEVDETIRDVMSWGRFCNDKVYGINGNHDGTNGSIPKTDNYSTMLRLNENYVVRENGAPYFYTDYDHHKIRAIFLCTNQQPAGQQPSAHIWGMGSDQLTWFTATLASVPAGYDIVIFSHIGTFDTEDFKTNRTECCTALNNWIANGGKCIGWFCGHEHLDCIVPTSASGINCPQVVLQCSLLGKWTPTPSNTYIYNLPWVSNDRTDKTVTQDCWTTLIYNKPDNKVYLVRFGAGNDMTIDLSDYD